MIREIVKIDEAKCDGCGLCVPSCHEGAIRMVNGKAKLSSDRLCDGIGDCLGHCPLGAITIVRREAADYDEALVAANMARQAAPQAAPQAHTPVNGAPVNGGCPGSAMRQFGQPARPAAAPAETGSRSDLSHWPVQISLIPAQAPMLRGARLLVAADCVPFAYPDFHAKLLRGRTVMVGCPKLDDLDSYVEKFTDVLRLNELQEVVVARMEVPCCTGILQAVLEARRRAGVEVAVREVVVGVQGQILLENEHPVQVTT